MCALDQLTSDFSVTSGRAKHALRSSRTVNYLNVNIPLVSVTIAIDFVSVWLVFVWCWALKLQNRNISCLFYVKDILTT